MSAMKLLRSLIVKRVHFPLKSRSNSNYSRMFSLLASYLLIILLFNLRTLHGLRSRVNLEPLRCPGEYTLQSGARVPAMFLGKPQLEVLQSESEEQRGRALLQDVVPLLVPDDPLQIVTSLTDKNVAEPVVNVIITRNLGFYDNLPDEWIDKRTFHSTLQRKMPVEGPTVAQLASFIQILGLHVKALVVETDDFFTDGTAALRGSVVVSKRDEFENIDSTAKVCCHLDELVGLSLALDKHIIISRQLFDKVSQSALLIKASDTSSCSMKVEGPLLPRKSRCTKNLCSVCSGNCNNKKKARSASASLDNLPIAAAWEIDDADRFLSLSILEKLAILSASGFTEPPKSIRDNGSEEAIDQMLLKLMKPTIRDEVIMKSSGTFGGKKSLIDYLDVLLDDKMDH